MYFKKRKNNIVLGTAGRFGRRRIWLGDTERKTHAYIVGITGKGKSKLIEHMIFQDIVGNRGCGILDPHSDLIDDLLSYLVSRPEASRVHWSRIIYLEPSRTDFVLPFNVLRTPHSPYETAQGIVESFRRAWPNTLAEAPRFSNIVVAGVLTLIANDMTLVELPRLLTDRAFRHSLLAAVSDSEVTSFWNERYDKWGRDQPRMIESVLNKVTAFTLNPQLRRILGARENSLEFGHIMDSGKVLLVDLGRCDVETRRLLGSLIVTGLEQAARSRKNDTTRRRSFHFYIDEFQDFSANEGTSQTLAQILSECRKYGLHLTLAHQTLTQIGPRLAGALGNIQTKVIFGVSRQDAESLASHVFRVDGERIKHLVQNHDQRTRSHPVFYSLHEEKEHAAQRLQSLPPRRAYAVLPGRLDPIPLTTVHLNYYKLNAIDLERVRSQLARRSASVTGLRRDQRVWRGKANGTGTNKQVKLRNQTKRANSTWGHLRSRQSPTSDPSSPANC